MSANLNIHIQRRCNRGQPVYILFSINFILSVYFSMPGKIGGGPLELEDHMNWSYCTDGSKEMIPLVG